MSSSSSNKCGCISGYHIPSSLIGTTGSSTHFGRVSGHCWTPSSLNPLPSTLKPMSRQRSSIRWLCTSCTCITLSIYVHGMRVFPMFNTTTTWLSIAPPSISPFRWGWDSNHWVPWMFHYPLRPPRKTRLMLQLELTKPPGSLNESSTSSNKLIIFYRSPMPSISNAMINTRCHTSFKWETKFGFNCRNNSL